MTASVIIAVDPGTADTGVVVLRAQKLIHAATLHVPSKWNLGARVHKLLTELDDAVKQYDMVVGARIDLVYERPIIMHGRTAFGAPQARDLRSLHELVGALEYWGRCRSYRVVGYEVGDIKTGVGGSTRASKEEVETALRLVWDLSGLAREPQTNHEWDALSVAHYHLSQEVVREREIKGAPR